MSIEAQHLQILDLVDDMSAALSQIDVSNPFTAFSCREVETICAVMEAAGNTNQAQAVRIMHAKEDDEGDEHHELRALNPWTGERE